jgi:uncharacterized NAD(P)/FAD-binding protein YdhS
MSDVLIIGGGFSGTLSAIELLNRSQARDTVILLEKRRGQNPGGIAYSSVTAEAFHETNIAAKNMGISADDPGELARYLGVGRDEVVPRRLVGEFLDAKLSEANTSAEKRGVKLRREFGQAVDIAENAKKVSVALADGRMIKSDRAILATGNPQSRRLPCIKDEDLKNPAFRKHFVADQWGRNEKKKVRSIPADAPVLVLGTALSGYDAARTLLRQGHKGPIVLMSRHGLEHFEYPKKHTWRDIDLPVPRFVGDLRRGEPERAPASLLAEFHELTGLQVDLDKGAIKRDSWLRQQFNRGEKYLPEQVLKQWEKQVPEIIRILGNSEFAGIMQKFSALIAVLRVGAGHGVAEEIKQAKKRGQVSVVAADLNAMTPSFDGLDVRYTPRGKIAPQTANFHTVISSLGPDHDYSHTNDPLWLNIFKRGYTTPHSLRVGVAARENPEDYGRLPNSRRIYAAGVCLAGNYMLEKGLIGPPAFSVPGMRDRITATAAAVANDNHRPNRPSPRRAPGLV